MIPNALSNVNKLETYCKVLPQKLLMQQIIFKWFDCFSFILTSCHSVDLHNLLKQNASLIVSDSGEISSGN